MTDVKKFFEGYEGLRHISGTLKGLSRAFELTGNSIMQEELLCLAQDILGAREKMYEEFQAAISQGCFSVKENGPTDPNLSVRP